MVTPLAQLENLDYSLSHVMTESTELHHLQAGQEQERHLLIPSATHLHRVPPLLT